MVVLSGFPGVLSNKDFVALKGNGAVGGFVFAMTGFNSTFLDGFTVTIFVLPITLALVGTKAATCVGRSLAQADLGTILPVLFTE